MPKTSSRVFLRIVSYCFLDIYSYRHVCTGIKKNRGVFSLLDIVYMISKMFDDRYISLFFEFRESGF